MSFNMSDPKTVLEGDVKYRDKKKWKSRWAVVSKLSPVADCLHIQLYRDSKERCKNGPTKASLSLEEFLGMETGFTLDKESNTMALICSELVVVLAFDNRELLIQWQVKIRANLVEEQQFLVQIAHVPPKSKLPCGPARLHLQDHTFCLVSGVPPRLLGTWPIKELRRFGVVGGKFCFEGGSLCGRGEGLHVLLTNQAEELSQSMDLASKGKLLGKRQTLSRKNSVLESSSRISPHKRNLHDSTKSTTGDSSRLLMSSGSECSTCDACSEILRSADGCGDNMIYSSSAASMKASSCRIHYRWPSCLSRWGQSSTTTTSDVESMDTVSVTLSDFQGPTHSSTMSKTNINGQSLSCLCDSQGTWPLTQCSKCGRHFYSRNSRGSAEPRNTGSPGPTTDDALNGFSPQWTMDTYVGATNDSQKDSTYQAMKAPSSDRVSLCSHASHSSTASSSESEYSVPKSYLESLYDRPKNIHHALNHKSNIASNGIAQTNGSPNLKPFAPNEKCIVCPCHEPIKDWMTASFSSSREKLIGSQECSCWSKLSMSVRSEVDIRLVKERKSASANPSPSSSPKKTKYNTGPAKISQNGLGESSCTCCKDDPYANYAVPRTIPMHNKDKQHNFSRTNGNKEKNHVPDPAEDYDVPKKFLDVLSNCDINHKTVTANGPACSCMSTCKIVQNIELFKMASKHQPFPASGEALQMCACQRVMLWAGSLVPCLGPQRPTADAAGWKAPDPRATSKTFFSHTVAVCSEPHKSTEVVLANGKPKHIVHQPNTEPGRNSPGKIRQRSNTVSSYPIFSNSEADSCYYANVDYPPETNSKFVKANDDSSSVNYANLEFTETLPLYENSNLVLSRLEDSNKEVVSPERPPLPPRSSQQPPNKMPPDSKPKSKSPKKSNPVNGYEMMCYQKNPIGDEDYLMMQPLCQQSETNIKPSPEVEIPTPPLPLRPFMPYIYADVASEPLSRTQQLVQQELRSARSNSLSELKKKVLMRKRSSSVDGKNDVVSSEAESVPASPLGNRRMQQRKNSLFSKLNIRSKEKSMSTNEITSPVPTSVCNGAVPLGTAHKNGFHRSAECLKVGEEYANSDDELNSDNSDFAAQKERTSMKRSSSVPCRSAVPEMNLLRTNGIIEEINDLNKTSEYVSKDPLLENEETPKAQISSRPNCDNSGRECFIENNVIGEMHVRNNVPISQERVVENCRSTTSSCSSSDISDYMESLSFISRSSSSSSGSTSSADYIRSEELYLLRTAPKASKSLSAHSNNITVPHVHQSRHHSLMEVNGIVEVANRPIHHHRHHVVDDSSSSPRGSSNGSYQESNPRMRCHVNESNDDAIRTRHHCTSVASYRDSRSSMSSTSSLSTSPSVTDYSSSTSSSPPDQNPLTSKLANKSQSGIAQCTKFNSSPRVEHNNVSTEVQHSQV